MLSLLLNVPRSAEEWNRFSFHHRFSHDLINSTIFKLSGQPLQDYVLDPILLSQPRLFLEANQQAHNDMNNALNLQGSNLEDVNLSQERELQSWIYLHWQEHQTAESKLSIAS